MGQAVLKAEGIVKRYGTNEVLHGVDLKIEPGHIYGLLGRNGAGKTTLLSILTAQNPADEGIVTYDDMPVWENPKALKGLCFSRELSPTMMSSSNNLRIKDYLLAASIYYENWDAEYAKKLCDSFGLEKKKKVGKLSKGMMSMVTIVIAMASRAPITILDEPVAGLDVVARESFYSLLLREYSETNRTFVISTHIIEEATKALEKVIIIDKGDIIADEDLDSLLAKFCVVSGKDDVVSEVCSGIEIVHTESFGRSKSVCVRKNAQDMAECAGDADVDISPVSLQQVFVYLSGGIEEVTL